jgi:hypothetical protein
LVTSGCNPSVARQAGIGDISGATGEGGIEMQAASPARLYATVVGAVLTVAGIIGFFYSSSFGSPGSVDDVFGILDVNGWHNVFHLVTGLLGLAAAGYAARTYALALGLLYVVVAIWGFTIGSGDSILGIVPINTEDNFLHLVLGVLGLGAGAASPTATTRRPATGTI